MEFEIIPNGLSTYCDESGRITAIGVNTTDGERHIVKIDEAGIRLVILTLVSLLRLDDEALRELALDVASSSAEKPLDLTAMFKEFKTRKFN